MIEVGEGTEFMVVGHGAALDYVCHSLGRKGVEFFVQKHTPTTFLVHVDISKKEWLSCVAAEFVARNFI